MSGWDLRVRHFEPTLSPAAVGSNSVAEQTFTVPGLDINDTVVAVNKPSVQNGLGIVGMRVSAQDTLAIAFINMTGGNITPTASEVYKVAVCRRQP